MKRRGPVQQLGGGLGDVIRCPRGGEMEQDLGFPRCVARRAVECALGANDLDGENGVGRCDEAK